MFVYREEYYLETDRSRQKASQPNCKNGGSKMKRANGLAEVIIGKQRHGPDRRC